tara:strand:- start:264 stop:533 length:270 start_codon:yes stop_codon:yes gene_type:complete
MWALKALNRLQSPENEDDKLVKEFTRLMNTDTAVAVRVAAVDNISACKQTLPAIVARVRDGKSESKTKTKIMGYFSLLLLSCFSCGVVH